MWAGLAVALAAAPAILGGCLVVYDKLTAVDIADIRKRGKLIAVTAYGPNSYFLYRGEPLGYEYELLTLLAKDMGVNLEIVLTKDRDNVAYMLQSGAGDIVAANITVTKQRTHTLQFTEHLNLTRQVLVQRRTGYRPPGSQTDWTVIRNPIELIGRKIHVRKGTAYQSRLKNLSEEIGGDIDVTLVDDDSSVEDLIRRVSTGEIDMTVADENVALINRGYYPGLDVDTPIGFPQRISWVVRNESPALLAWINDWIRRNRQASTFAMIHNRYYLDPRNYAERVASEFSSFAGGKISPFDDQLKKIAAQSGWDWKLLASLVYQESRFNPMARSWAGAMGLMQLMPGTAGMYGISNPYDPAENMRGGTSHLKWLFEYWKDIKDPEEKLKFILASYNAGHGHVEDARRLAGRQGRKTDVWTDNVEMSMLDLSKPEYFSNPVVQFGYCRGEEPYLYVREILERHKHYKKFTK